MNVNEKNYDEATEWLARLRASDVSDKDHEKFALWLTRDTANKPAFDAMLRIWEDLGVVSHFSPSDFVDTHSETGFAGKSPVKNSIRPLYASFALAATLVFAFAALFVFQNTGLEYSTGTSQFKLVTLEDGSQVKLNNDSRILVEFSSQQRLLHLVAGEAFFEVKKDARRPFVVESRNSSIHAIGTSFGVWDTGSETRITVTEGVVKVSNASRSVDLNANQQARVAGAKIILVNVDALSLTAWRDGRLEYDGVSLEALIEDMNRYMPRKVIIASNDTELNAHRVSGIIEIGDQDSMLQALQQSLIIPIEIELLSNNQIIITRTN